MMGRKITEAEAPTTAMELLTAVMQEYEGLGQRLAAVAERAKSETDDIKAEAQMRAAELDDARLELVEVRSALETEKTMRTAAEARVRKLEFHVRQTRLACDAALAEDDQTPRAERGVDQGVAHDVPLSEALGLTTEVLAALDQLTVQEGAASHREMMNLLLFRALENAGLLQEAVPDGNTVSAGREETQRIPG